MFVLTIQAVQKPPSNAYSPPPSYCSGDTREAVTISRSRGAPATSAAARSRRTAARVRPTVTPRSPAARLTSVNPVRATPAQDTRTSAIAPVSSQSMDNIDLAIFGSVVRLPDPSTAAGDSEPVVPGSGTLQSPGNGVVLDVGSVFTGSRPPARLNIPRFRPPNNRSHAFDPTRLLRVMETSQRSPIFSCL